MATASELISNKGSENLGLGSNADIPISSSKDLDVVNQAARDLMYQEAARNTLIYNQKIKDRDNLTQALSAGQVKVGDMLEQDRPIITKALDAQTMAFKNWMKKGYGDIEGAAAYKKATQEANMATTQAQLRFKQSIDDLQDAGKETDPDIQSKKQANVKGYLNNFWATPTPYQQMLGFDPKAFDETVTLNKHNIYDKKNAVTGSESYYSFPDILNKNEALYSTGKGRNYALQLSNELIKKPGLLASANAQIMKHNKEMTDSGHTEDVLPIDPGKDTPAVMAAKFALSRQPQFYISDKKTDNALLDYKQAASRLGLDWTKFNEAQGQDINSADAVVNEATDIIKKGTPTQVERGGKTVEVIRIGEPTLLQKFGTIDKGGNVTNPPDAIDYDKSTDQLRLIYYEGKTESGKNKIVKEVPLDQRTWLKEITKRSFPNKDIGGINEQVDKVLTKSGNSLYKLSQTYGNKQPAAEMPAKEKTPTKNVLIFSDGTFVDLTKSPLSEAEIKAAIKAGAKRQ